VRRERVDVDTVVSALNRSVGHDMMNLGYILDEASKKE
jgi:hypothetical protein